MMLVMLMQIGPFSIELAGPVSLLVVVAMHLLSVVDTISFPRIRIPDLESLHLPRIPLNSQHHSFDALATPELFNLTISLFDIKRGH